MVYLDESFAYVSGRSPCLIVVEIVPVQFEYFQKLFELIQVMQKQGLPNKMTQTEIEKSLQRRLMESIFFLF